MFLLNIFSKNHSVPDLRLSCLDYLFVFLSNLNYITCSKDEFIRELNKKNWGSYSSLCEFLIEMSFINHTEFTFCKERVLAEYIAFKRFYFLLVSEIKNF